MVGGIGVGGLVLGSAFGLGAISNWNSAKKTCSATSCPSSTRGAAESSRDAAVVDATVSTVAFVAGGAFLAGGVVLFLLAPRSAESKQGVVVTPTVGAGEAGLLVRGTF